MPAHWNMVTAECCTLDQFPICIACMSSKACAYVIVQTKPCACCCSASPLLTCITLAVCMKVSLVCLFGACFPNVQVLIQLYLLCRKLVPNLRPLYAIRRRPTPVLPFCYLGTSIINITGKLRVKVENIISSDHYCTGSIALRP